MHTRAGAAAPREIQAADPRRWRVLAVLGLSLLLIGLDNTILNVALPSLQRDLGASGSQLQWVVDAYVLAFAALLLPMGAVADRFGRKLVLQAGLIVFGLASVSAVLAQESWHLIAARGAMGIGGALIMPSTLSIITHVFPPEERGKAIGAWAAIAGIGVGIGPLVGGALVEATSWKAVFLLNLPVLALALAAGWRTVPESRDPLARRLDARGALLAAAGLTALVWAIIEAPSRGWTSPVTMGVGAAGLALGAALVAWQRRAAQPMLDLSVFRDARFSMGSAAIGIAFLALFGSIFLLTQYLQLVRDLSALGAGYRVAPIAIGLVLGAGASHRLVDRAGARIVVASGLALLAALLASIATWDAETADAQLVPTLVGIAAAMGLVMAPATSLVMSAVPDAKAGVGSAMNDVTRQVGGALGVAVLGSVLGTIYSDRFPDRVAGASAATLAAARDSVGGAETVATRLPGDAGAALEAAAAGAFLDGLGLALTVAAGVAALGAALALRLLPPRPAAAPAPTDTIEVVSERQPV